MPATQNSISGLQKQKRKFACFSKTHHLVYIINKTKALPERQAENIAQNIIPIRWIAADLHNQTGPFEEMKEQK